MKIATAIRIFFCVLLFGLFAAGPGAGPGSAGLNFQKRPEDSRVSEARRYLREHFQQARRDPALTEELIRYIVRKFSDDDQRYPAVILSYYGNLIGLRAKHSAHPFVKMKNLSASLTLLDRSVQAPGADLEVFFMRFAALQHMPPLMGISKKRREDVSQICRLLEERDYSVFDQAFQLTVVDFLLQSDRLSRGQISRMQSLRKKLSLPPDG